jgi:hypothetical protein
LTRPAAHHHDRGDLDVVFIPVSSVTCLAQADMLSGGAHPAAGRGFVTLDPATDTGRRWTSTHAYSVVLLLYVVGWGYGLASALAYLSSPTQGGGHVSAAGALVDSALVLGTDVGVLALVFCIAKMRGLSAADLGLNPPADKPARWRDLDIVLVYWASLVAAGLVANLLGGSKYPFAHGTWAALPSVLLALGAGPTEELALLALPVVLLREGREPVWRMALVLVVVRLSFHIYYGIGALGLAVWAVVILALFLKTGRALPLLVAHSLFDVVLTIGHFFPSTDALLGLAILLAIGLGLVRLGARAVQGVRLLRN